MIIIILNNVVVISICLHIALRCVDSGMDCRGHAGVVRTVDNVHQQITIQRIVWFVM